MESWLGLGKNLMILKLNNILRHFLGISNEYHFLLKKSKFELLKVFVFDHRVLYKVLTKFGKYFGLFKDQ
jgi:hypothetical protein